MEKTTKEIITREFIENELRFLNRASIRAGLALTASTALISIPITAMLLWFAVSSHVILGFKIFLCIFSILVGCSPMLPGVLFWIRTLSQVRLLGQGAYDVSLQELSYKCEKYVRRHYKEVLCFSGFEDVEVGHTAYQLASAGDAYYLVTYRTRRKETQLLYAAKMYEYRE